MRSRTRQRANASRHRPLRGASRGRPTWICTRSPALARVVASSRPTYRPLPGRTSRRAQAPLTEVRDLQRGRNSAAGSRARRRDDCRGETTEVELSRTQQTIARRMAESKATIPHFALQTDIDMEECVALRSELKRLGQADAPTYNDMVVKACALALREHRARTPAIATGACSCTARERRRGRRHRVGGARRWSADRADHVRRGHQGARRDRREARALAARVRDGSITPPELGGGTFTVSNLGMFGVTSFTAIINPPQAAILSVGSVKPDRSRRRTRSSPDGR